MYNLFLRVSNVDQNVKSHKYIFDMGYPYFMNYNNNILAFSSDIGICTYKLI